MAQRIVLLAVQLAVLSDFKMVRVLELKAATQHVQGIDFNDRLLWVTSVDKQNRKGWLQEFSIITGEMTRQIEIGDGSQSAEADGDVARDEQ